MTPSPSIWSEIKEDIKEGKNYPWLDAFINIMSAQLSENGKLLVCNPYIKQTKHARRSTD